MGGHLRFKVTFTKGRGALLIMLRPRLTVITNPGRLLCLFNDRSDWSDIVLVSELYTCPSYARLLTNRCTREVSLGLGTSAPIAPAIGGDAHLQWKTNSASGDFKSAHFIPEERGVSEAPGEPVCYPLYKLVAARLPYPGAPVSVIGRG